MQPPTTIQWKFVGQDDSLVCHRLREVPFAFARPTLLAAASFVSVAVVGVGHCGCIWQMVFLVLVLFFLAASCFNVEIARIVNQEFLHHRVQLWMQPRIGNFSTDDGVYLLNADQRR